MKKLLALLLTVVLCMSLAACATTPKDATTETAPAGTTAAADNKEDAPDASEPAAEGGKNIVWAGWSGEE